MKNLIGDITLPLTILRTLTVVGVTVLLWTNNRKVGNIIYGFVQGSVDVFNDPTQSGTVNYLIMVCVRPLPEDSK